MAKSSSGALLFSLAEVWKPVQQEVSFFFSARVELKLTTSR